MLCVLPGTLTETEVKELLQNVEDTLKKYGGTIAKTHDMGKNRLAYPMQHIRYGYFQLFYFSAEPEALAEIERRIRLIGKLLRIIIRGYNPEKVDPVEFISSANITPSATTAPEKEVAQIPEVTIPKAKKPAMPVVKKEEKPAEVSETTAEKADLPADKKEEKIAEEKPAPEKKGSEVTLEQIDEKLDELLEKDLENL